MYLSSLGRRRKYATAATRLTSPARKSTMPQMTKGVLGTLLLKGLNGSSKSLRNMLAAKNIMIPANMKKAKENTQIMHLQI